MSRCTCSAALINDWSAHSEFCLVYMRGRIKELEARDKRRKAKYLAVLDEMNSMQSQLDAVRETVDQLPKFKLYDKLQAAIGGGNCEISFEIADEAKECRACENCAELQSQVNGLQNIKIPQMQAILNQAFDQRDKAEAQLEAIAELPTVDFILIRRDHVMEIIKGG